MNAHGRLVRGLLGHRDFGFGAALIVIQFFVGHFLSDFLLLFSRSKNETGGAAFREKRLTQVNTAAELSSSTAGARVLRRQRMRGPPNGSGGGGRRSRRGICA